MADQKITDLTADTSPTSDDLVIIVNDPAGTPANKKVTLASLFAALQTWIFAADAGANDTYAATLSPVPAGYVTGQHYRFKANTANTGACTINFNTLGAKAIKKAVGGITTDLDDNDIRAGQWVDVVYDGTNMQIQSTLGNAQGGAPSGAAGGDLSGTYPNPTVIKTSLTAAHGSDDTYTGTTIAGLNAGATIAQWEPVYLGASSTWLLADANGSGTYPARGLAVAAYVNTDPAIILVHGTVRNDDWAWTPGGTIYLSGTAGAITQTPPATSGDKVQQVGFALTADVAFFDFNNTFLTVT
jgi:hypothetical protein